jgi:hypothetical protein
VKYASFAELPEKGHCRTCNTDKPIAEMMVVRMRKQKTVLLRPRCKACHNKHEKGHRREYKTKYLRRWRKDNAELTTSYWKQNHAANRKKYNAQHAKWLRRHHSAILIQGRLRRQAGIHVNLKEARRLCRIYGVAYPTRYGLTEGGRREAERIRASQRKLPKSKRMKLVEIRMIVYEDGRHKKPWLQTQPYQIAANRLREWQANRRAA